MGSSGQEGCRSAIYPAARAAHACAVLAPDLDGMEASSSGCRRMMMLLFDGVQPPGASTTCGCSKNGHCADVAPARVMAPLRPELPRVHCRGRWLRRHLRWTRRLGCPSERSPSAAPAVDWPVSCCHAASLMGLGASQAGAMPSPRASPLLASRRMLTSSIITFGGSANPTEHGDATFFNDAYRLDLEPLLSALDSAQAEADAATASSAAQRDAPEVETEGIDPDATAALHTAKKPRVETHEEIETSEEDAAGSARKDGPPIAPEAVVAIPMPAVPPVTFDFESASPRSAHRRPRVRRRRRYRLSSVAPSLCKMYG